MQQYLDYLRHVKTNGKFKSDRTGTGTVSTFGYQMRFDLQKGFPLITTKKLHLKSIIHELIWFLSGDTNIKYLVENDVHIWDDWATPLITKTVPKTISALKPIIGELDSAELKEALADGWKEMSRQDLEVTRDGCTATEIVIKLEKEIIIGGGELGPVYGEQWRKWKTGEFKLVPITSPKERIAAERQLVKDTTSTIPTERWAVMNKVQQQIDDIERVGGTPTSQQIYDMNFELDHIGVVSTKYEPVTIDQIADVIHTLKNNPDSRRILVSSWDVASISRMKLPPCHLLFQLYADDLTQGQRHEMWCQKMMADTMEPWSHEELDGFGIPRKRLSCQLYQRSVDSFLGLPFNIASYALLTHMLAQQTNMVVGDFIWVGGDCHIYSNHMEQVDLQLTREPLPLPQLKLNKAASIFDYKFEDFEIVGYEAHPHIKGAVAV